MTLNRIIFLGILFLIIVIGALVLVFVPSKQAQAPTAQHPGTDMPAQPASLENLITVSAPLPKGVVSSPLTIAGQARGSWYFEAQAPVLLEDGSGAVIAQGSIRAQGDWMTGDYVPFTGTLTFTAPTVATGTLVLKNDNPSGDPGRQRELAIPVRFR